MEPTATPKDILERALQTRLVDPDGEAYEPKLIPGMTDAEINEAERRLPCPIPPDIRELLRFSRGLEEPAGDFLFVCSDVFGYEELFCHGVELVPDGYGNAWVLDLTPSTTVWGPVLFACHDAPVLLYQCDTFAEFLEEWFKLYIPPHKSLVDDVHEDRLFDVWRTNPGAMTSEEASRGDTVLSEFAKRLGECYLFVDLRNAAPGQGFSWGRYGPKTKFERCGEHRIFAYRKPDRKGLARFFLGPYID